MVWKNDKFDKNHYNQPVLCSASPLWLIQSIIQSSYSYLVQVKKDYRFFFLEIFLQSIIHPYINMYAINFFYLKIIIIFYWHIFLALSLFLSCFIIGRLCVCLVWSFWLKKQVERWRSSSEESRWKKLYIYDYI